MLKTNRSRKQVFISYAWPVSKADCVALQSQLLSIVEDMAIAGVDVLLDICCLRVGVDIVSFMERGIQTSDSILWIGTTHLVQRISFNPDNTPANPATIEFCHIQNKIKHLPFLYTISYLKVTVT
jgi:hypothetical protein